MPIDPATIGALAVEGVERLRGRVDPVPERLIIAPDNTVRFLQRDTGLRAYMEYTSARTLARARGTIPPRTDLERAINAYLAGGPAPSGDIIRQIPTEDWNRVLDIVEAQALAPPPGTGGDVPFDPAQPADTLFGAAHLTPVGVEDYFVPRFVRGLHTSIPGGEAGMRQMPVAVLVGLGASRTTTRRRSRLARGEGARIRRRAARRPKGGGVMGDSGYAQLDAVRRGREVYRRRTKKRGKKGHLVKGSRAAKLHMAKLRRMRKRKRR